MCINSLFLLHAVLVLQPQDCSAIWTSALKWLGRSSKNNINTLVKRDVNRNVRWRHFPDYNKRLVSWDRKSPNIVFSFGLLPEVTNERQAIENNFDLYSYVNWNTASIFVSTTKTQTKIYNGKEQDYVWTPRNIKDIYQYEIFAPGGIDVNPTLTRKYNKWYNQHEVAFPGGIRKEFIRSVRVYNENGHLIQVLENPYFIKPMGALPDIKCKNKGILREWSPESELMAVIQLWHVTYASNNPMKEIGEVKKTGCN